MQATYSPEDNKLRLYASSRLDAETFAEVKAAGFKWAPKQELFVAPSWTPDREDLCIRLAGDIEPEQTTILERAEAKAERLQNIAENRARQANAFSKAASDISERFAAGQPILVGHHSERKARKDADRMDSLSRKAAKAFDSINYWNDRAAGAERHANRKNDSRTRAKRIKTLLAALRDLQRDLNKAHKSLEVWQKATPAMVPAILGRSQFGGWNDYSDFESGKYTAEETIERNIRRNTAIIESPKLSRWIEHTLNRLGYETAELGDVARFECDLTPVILQAFARTHGAEKPKATKTEQGFTISSPVPLPQHIAGGSTELTLSESAWRDLMQQSGYEVPAPKPRRQSAKAPNVPLINPTLEDAERLQALFNQRMVEACTKPGQNAKPNEVTQMTQARYSAYSKGTHFFKTVEFTADGQIIRQTWANHQPAKTGEPAFRCRIYTGQSGFYKPNSIVVITDKPAKPLPIAWPSAQVEAA